MILYILSHNSVSRARAESLARKYRAFADQVEVLQLKNCGEVFQESSCFIELMNPEHKENWSKHKRIGIITYSFEEKFPRFTGLTQQFTIDWRSFEEPCNDNIDLFSLLGLRFMKEDQPISWLEGTTIQHGLNFYKAWIAVIHLLYGDRQLSEAEAEDQTLDPQITSNWLVMSRSFLEEYGSFICHLRDLLTEDKQDARACHSLLMKNACYRGKLNERQCQDLFGVPYFPLYPFVLERLINFFVHFYGKRHKYLCVSSLQF